MWFGHIRFGILLPCLHIAVNNEGYKGHNKGTTTDPGPYNNAHRGTSRLRHVGILTWKYIKNNFKNWLFCFTFVMTDSSIFASQMSSCKILCFSAMLSTLLSVSLKVSLSTQSWTLKQKGIHNCTDNFEPLLNG